MAGQECKEYVIKALSRDIYTKEIKKDENGNPIKYYYETYQTSDEHLQNFTFDLKKAKRFEFVSDAKAEAKKRAVAKLFHDDPDDYFVVKLKPKSK